MVITRDTGMIKLEIRLTSDELYAAYAEQQHLFDLQDCESHFDNEYCEENWYPVDNCMRDSIIEETADELRRNINKYDMDFEHAISDAFAYVIPKYILYPHGGDCGDLGEEDK